MWVTVASGVDEVLLRSSVRSDKSNKIVSIDGLVLEKFDELVCRVLFSRKKAGRASLAVIFAPNEGSKSWSKRTNYGRDIGTELDDICHTHAVLIVFGVPLLCLISNCRKTVVVRTRHLVAEEDTAVCTTITAALRPDGRIMKTQADGLTSKLAATTGCTVEFGGHFVRQPFPMAAQISFAGSASDVASRDGAIYGS